MESKIGLAGLCLMLLAASFPVAATLGEDVRSVIVDQKQMEATLQITDAGKFAVHTIHLPSGTAVRQYVAPTGLVFAVSWQGPSLPDLRQVLGRYFNQYAEAVKSHGAGGGARAVLQPDLVVQSGGRMRSFTGRAYVPQLLPQGVLAEEIK